MRFNRLALAAGAGVAFALPLAAQQPAAAPPPDPKPLAVGAVAPDFALPGSTRPPTQAPHAAAASFSRRWTAA